jgi:cell division protein FtsB
MKRSLLILLALLILLHLLFSDHGLFEYVKLKKRLSSMEEQVRKLESENTHLEERMEIRGR